VDQLFEVVPEALRLQHGLELAAGCAEPDVMASMEEFAARNRARSDHMVCFAGGGAYDHETPPVTRALAGRSEFVTSYTPYQPEVAQGVLQAVFEFQTMVARLAGLPIANASLYDGGSAMVEAVNLGVAASGRQCVWVSAGVHPHWRELLATCAVGTGHRIVTVPLVDGITAWPDPDGGGDPPGVVVASYPNYLGCIEDLGAARQLCDRVGALLVVGTDPVDAGVLKSVGEWGADVMVGEGQAFGTSLGFGGPYLGLFACASAHVRRLPGRLVGETVDVDGRRAYVTTLRAREQDIRREKATSNVCTNQTLMAVTAAIQLGWLGTAGLAEVARRCAQATRYTRQAVLALDGIEAASDAPVLREFAVRLPTPAPVVIERMADAGFLAGIALDAEYVEGERGLLIAVTERRTRAEIDAYVTALAKAVA
jgi:glycine dehydrogenase subunit 1